MVNSIVLLAVFLILSSNLLLFRQRKSLSSLDRITLAATVIGDIIGFVIIITSEIDLIWKILISVIIVFIGFAFVWNKIFARTKGITKKLGSTYLIKDGVQHYLSRRDLPLETIFSIVKQEIIFVSVSHEFVARFEEELIMNAIHRGVSITVLVLKPNSVHISFKEKLFGKAVKNLNSKIKEILEILCAQKAELKDKSNRLIIKTYDSPLEDSIMIVDPFTNKRK